MNTTTSGDNQSINQSIVTLYDIIEANTDLAVTISYFIWENEDISNIQSQSRTKIFDNGASLVYDKEIS